MSESAAPVPAGGTNPQELKSAFKAFKKKLKILRLERESRQIAGPLSKGSSSGIVAITPPSQYPQAFWDELVKQGKLKDAGGGTYEVVGE